MGKLVIMKSLDHKLFLMCLEFVLRIGDITLKIGGPHYVLMIQLAYVVEASK